MKLKEAEWKEREQVMQKEIQQLKQTAQQTETDQGGLLRWDMKEQKPNDDLKGHVKLNRVASHVSDNAARLGDSNFNSKRSLTMNPPAAVKPKNMTFGKPIYEKQ